MRFQQKRDRDAEDEGCYGDEAKEVDAVHALEPLQAASAVQAPQDHAHVGSHRAPRAHPTERHLLVGSDQHTKYDAH